MHLQNFVIGAVSGLGLGLMTADKAYSNGYLIESRDPSEIKVGYTIITAVAMAAISMTMGPMVPVLSTIVISMLANQLFDNLSSKISSFNQFQKIGVVSLTIAIGILGNRILGI